MSDKFKITNEQIEILDNMCFGANEVQLGTLLYNTKDEIDEINITLERIKYYGSADIVPSDESYFTVNETGETITGLTDTGKTQTELVIPYKINGVEITSIGDGAFNGSSLTSINIPNSVTSIEVGAFEGCTNLTIYCEQGSYAETYAKDNNIPVVYTDVKAIALVGQKTAEGGEIFNDYTNNQASGNNSHAEGANTKAGGYGYKIIATENGSNSVGIYTLSSITGLEVGMRYSVRLATAKYDVGAITAIDSANNKITVDNYPNIALETDADDPSNYVIENYLTIVGRPDLGDTEIGFNAHTEGRNTIAQDVDTHAEGRDTKAIGQYGHAEGRNTTAGYAAHAECRDNVALGDNSHAEGYNTKAIGNTSHAEGRDTEALGNYSHAEGLLTKAIGNASHAEGRDTEATGDSAHAEGEFTKALAKNSHAEGYNTKAIGNASHAEGGFTEATGDSAHAEGYGTKSTGYASHSQGTLTQATGDASFAGGNSTIASGNNSCAIGRETKAEGYGSLAEGYKSEARADYSHAGGNNTIATTPYQHTQGKCNILDTENKYADIVGNGTSNEERSNAYTLDWNGNGWFAGDVKVGINNDRLATEKVVDDKIASIISIDGEAFMIDSELNKESKNAVQNKVVTNAISDVQADIVSVTGGTYDVKCHATETMPMGKSVVVKEIHTPYGVNTTNATVMCDDCESLMKVGSTVALTCQGSSIRSINDQANSEYVMVYDDNWYVVFEVEVVGEISEIKREIKTIAVNPTNTVVINTQSDFDNMVASSNWLDARFVLFNTNVRATTTITVPSNVRCIDGNGFKITFDSGEYFGYSNRSYLGEFKLKKDRIVRNLCVAAPSNDGFKGYRYFYSVDNCNFIGVGNTNNNYGFYECYNLLNCSVSRRGSQGSPDGNYGYYNCKNLIGCVSECGRYDNGFYGCENLMSCSAWTVQGTNSGGISGNGFEACIGLSHCKVEHKGAYQTYVGTETKYAYYLCSTLNYCTVKYTATTQESCGFKECNNLQNCSGEATNDKVFVYDSCSSLFECTGKINTENCVSVVSIAQLAALME